MRGVEDFVFEHGEGFVLAMAEEVQQTMPENHSILTRKSYIREQKPRAEQFTKTRAKICIGLVNGSPRKKG